MEGFCVHVQKFLIVNLDYSMSLNNQVIHVSTLDLCKCTNNQVLEVFGIQIVT